MTIEVIFNKQTINGFNFDSAKGASRASLSGAFTLTAGQYYEVGWDEKTYTRKAYTLNGDSTVYIGNELRQKGEIDDITEPFIIAYVPGTNQNLFYAYDTSSSHIVGISTAEEPNSVLVKDWHGKDHEFTGHDTVYIRNAGGDAQPYTHGLLGSDIETPADFSGGDMILTAEDGDFVEKVTVQKPENLIPGNIAEGVDIAGIIGTLVSGGGANIVCTSGTFKNPTVGNFSVSHNLGVTPDIVIIYTTEFTSVSSADVLRFFVGFSTAFSQAIDGTLIGFALRNRYATISGGYKAYREITSEQTGSSFSRIYVDSANPGFAGIVYGANEESFILNNASGQSGYVDSALTYKWLAIGGLT